MTTLNPSDLKLQVSVEPQDDCIVVRLSGDADLASVDSLNVEINRVIVRRPNKVVFDVAGLRMLASLAIGALVSCATSVRRRGGSAHVVNASPLIRDLLLRSRLDAIFQID